METANSCTACWYWWLPVIKGGGGVAEITLRWLSPFKVSPGWGSSTQLALTVYGYVLTLVDIFDKTVMVPLLYISRLFFWQILCRSFYNINYDLIEHLACCATTPGSQACFPCSLIPASSLSALSENLACPLQVCRPAGELCLRLQRLSDGRGLPFEMHPNLWLWLFSFFFFCARVVQIKCVCLTPLSVRREAASSSCAFSWASSCWESSWSRTTSLKSASREWTTLLFLSCYVCA